MQEADRLMAFVPDNAIKTSGELSPAAFRLYCVICSMRSKKTGGYWVSFGKAEARMDGLTEPTYFRARRELLDKEWVVELDNNFLVPVRGFETIKSDSDWVVRMLKTEVQNDSSTINSDSPTITADSSTINSDSEHIRNNQPVDQTLNQTANQTPSLRSGGAAAVKCDRCNGSGQIYRRRPLGFDPCPDCNPVN
ncbi:MAG: hypothetical protein ACK4S4_09385 [Pyrinomonadaceae bacterium]